MRCLNLQKITKKGRTNELCGCKGYLRQTSNILQIVAGANEHDRMIVYNKLCHRKEKKKLDKMIHCTTRVAADEDKSEEKIIGRRCLHYQAAVTSVHFL